MPPDISQAQRRGAAAVRSTMSWALAGMLSSVPANLLYQKSHICMTTIDSWLTMAQQVGSGRGWKRARSLIDALSGHRIWLVPLANLVRRPLGRGEGT